MQKSTKGALAAAAAGTLLLGGAGSLAFWQSTASVSGSTVTAGHLNLTQDSCGDWQLDSDGGTGGDLAGRLLVPGDSLSKVCTYTIDATGDHLEAELDIDEPNWSGDLEAALTTDADFTLDGDPVTPGTAAEFTEGTHTVIATFTVDFPYGSSADNSSFDDTATLDTIGLTVTQVDNH
jgi:alternate signal-mediated exported protein